MISLTAFGQTKKSMNNFTGLYFGSQSYGEKFNVVGYYYFRADSSFAFFRTGLIPGSRATEFLNRFNDTLVGYGKGKWFIHDGFLVTKFETFEDENILQGEIKYNAYSQRPYDSLFLKVKVTNYDSITLNLSTVSISNKFIGKPADASEYKEIVLPLSYNREKLIVQKEGYLEKSIKLQFGYNVHDVTITLAPKDNSTIDLISEVQIPYKFHYEDKKIVFDGKLKRQSLEKKKITMFIKNSFKKFPNQTIFLQKIMDELD